MTALIGLLFIFGLIALLIGYETFAYGLVVYKSYYWFALPVFTSLPHISYIEAVGLTFLLTLFKNKNNSDLYFNDKKIESKPNWFGLIMGPWISLLIAFLFKVIFM
jgi:hypothetical protein